MRDDDRPEKPRDPVPWTASESLEDFVRRHYCVVGPAGELRQDKVDRVEAALRAVNERPRPGSPVQLVPVDGVPFLRAVAERVEDVPVLVRRFLPMVEADPRLHALSFIDPLRLASDELGIAVAPRIARWLRWELRHVASFDSAAAADVANRLAQYSRMRWRPKPGRERTHAV